MRVTATDASSKRLESDTYGAVLAESLLEVSLGGGLAEARDVEVVARVVVASVALGAVMGMRRELQRG